MAYRRFTEAPRVRGRIVSPRKAYFRSTRNCRESLKKGQQSVGSRTGAPDRSTPFPCDRRIFSDGHSRSLGQSALAEVNGYHSKTNNCEHRVLVPRSNDHPRASISSCLRLRRSIRERSVHARAVFWNDSFDEILLFARGLQSEVASTDRAFAQRSRDLWL